jgi:hypothetical protein
MAHDADTLWSTLDNAWQVAFAQAWDAPGRFAQLIPDLGRPPNDRYLKWNDLAPGAERRAQ